MARKNAKLQESIDRITFDGLDTSRLRKRGGHSPGGRRGMQVGRTRESIARVHAKPKGSENP